MRYADICDIFDTQTCVYRRFLRLGRNLGDALTRRRNLAPTRRRCRNWRCVIRPALSNVAPFQGAVRVSAGSQNPITRSEMGVGNESRLPSAAIYRNSRQLQSLPPLTAAIYRIQITVSWRAKFSRPLRSLPPLSPAAHYRNSLRPHICLLLAGLEVPPPLI